jgi:hypothetical protein
MLREDARTLCCFGLSRHFASLEQAAGDCEKQIARIQRPDPPDPFVVERRSKVRTPMIGRVSSLS